MTKSRLRLVAIVTAVLLLAGSVAASALTLPLLPNPLFPPRPAEVPAEVPWPTDPPLPPVADPDPEAILAVLQAQVEAIAESLGTTPEALLAQILATEAPDAESITLTIEGLLERLTGAQIPDEQSRGLAGLPEIAIGNISHNFSVTRLMPAGTDFVRKCIGTLASCATSATTAPSPNLNEANWEQFRYSMVQSSWLPSAPAASVLGTSILLPLVTAQLPAPVPPEAAPLLALFKPNAVLASQPGGLLTSIQGGNWTTVGSDGTVQANGRHNGGTGLLNGSNVDTAQRSDPTAADPGAIDPNNPSTIVDQLPIWVPLLTSSGLLTNTLPDTAIDFVGFGKVNAPTTFSPATSCTNTGGTANVDQTIDGVQMRKWGAQVCTARGSMSGFGIAIYSGSPLNFRTDLAPLWGPAPVPLQVVNTSAANLVAALQPFVPSQSALLLYALGALLPYAQALVPDPPATPEVPAP